MDQKGKASFVKGAAILAVAGILCKVIGVLIKMWAYDVIGETGMVYYEIVFPFYSWLLIIASSGIPTAISRMVAQRASLSDYAGARKVFFRSLLLLTGIGAATSAILYFGADYITCTVLCKAPEAALAFRMLAPSLLFVSVLCAFRGYLQGMQRMAGTGISQIAEQAVKCAAGLYLASVWIVKGPVWGAAGLILGITVSEFVALAIMAVFLRASRKHLMPPGACSKAVYGEHIVSDILRIALPITLGASILPITTMLDVDMIYRILGAYMTEPEINQCYVALSTNVRSLINLPAQLSVALAMSLVPAISAASAQRDIKGVRRAAGMGLRLGMVVGIPCAAGLFVLGGPIIAMLFRSISADSLEIAEQIMRVASVTVIFITLAQTMTGALQGIGKQRLPVYALLFGAAAKVLTNVVLMRLPSVNILGASYSNIACYGVAGILDTVFFLRCTGMRVRFWRMFGKPLAASVIMGAVVYYVYRLLYALHPGTLVTLLSIVVGAVVYLLLVFALRMFSPKELSMIPGGRRLARFTGGKQS